MNWKITFLLSFFTSTVLLGGEVKKNIETARTNIPPHIDGKLDDACWATGNVATDFTTNAPQFGNPAALKTEVRITYDNTAMYVVAFMHDNKPEKMLSTLTKRDQLRNVETFVFGFDTYHDGLNSYRFEVSLAGVQADARMSPNNTDYNWDAVWESKVSVSSDGWIVEAKVPFSAIRFPDKETQDWGLQFARNIGRLNEFNTWSPVDPNISGVINQWGHLIGITNIKPPVRLSFSPYLSTSWEQTPIDNGYSTKQSINGGMDLKYGINESFTLDMTLVPDFGQVQSDKKVLNLSAFETRFDEKRTFFTEGAELFRQGDRQFRDGELFYSRRIGSTPSGYYSISSQIDSSEEIEKNPSETQLYNATKLTGRTNKGLGIGIFNAITAPMFATVKNTENNSTRKIQSSPFTNYNILVFEQSLKNNSKISILNASTIREGNYTDANVTSMNYDLRILKNTYAFSGFANYSQRFNESFEDGKQKGYYYNFIFQKVSGKFKFDLSNSGISKDYNQSDLGYQRAKNEMSYFAGASYSINKTEKGPFLNWSTYLSWNYTTRIVPMIFQELSCNAGFDVQLRNFWYAGFYFNAKPIHFYDFYEPRVAGAKYDHFGYEFGGIYINTDKRKKFFMNTNFNYGESPYPNDPYKEISFELNFRASDHLLFAYGTDLSKDMKSFGWVEDDGTLNHIIYGRRDVSTISNEFLTQWSFNAKTTLSVRVRHYWSKAEYSQYYQLTPDGKLIDIDYAGNADVSYNQFNVDMDFNWQFAPGSFFSAVWKNDISQQDQLTHQNYFDNVNKTSTTPQSNRFSLNIIYYLDYLNLRKKTAH